MHVDLPNLERKLERFYTFYKDTLKFILPGSNADKYRMLVMLNYSGGTAYGGDYDQTIGAFWVAPTAYTMINSTVWHMNWGTTSSPDFQRQEERVVETRSEHCCHTV